MNTAVYYPHIYPTPEWLRLAALCWDKVYRLTPTDYWYEDPEDLSELDAALGRILEDVEVAVVADNEIQRQFELWLAARAEKLKVEARAEKIRDGSLESHEHEEVKRLLSPVHSSKFRTDGLFELLQKYDAIWQETDHSTEKIPDWENDEYYQRQLETESPVREVIPKPGSAHEQYEKLREKARKKSRKGDIKGAEALEQEAEKIRQQHLITITHNYQLIYLPKDIALYYLSLCASKVAMEGKRDLVADAKQFTDIIFYSNEALRGEVAVSALQAYLPKNFFTLEPERILEFRSEFATQRLKYQKEIQSLVDEFSGVASEGQLEHIKKSILEIAQERIDETKKTYQKAKMDMFITTFGLSLTPPALATSLASILGIGIFAPAGIAATLSLFVAKALLDRDRARSEKRQSPWSYVLDSVKKL